MTLTAFNLFVAFLEAGPLGNAGLRMRVFAGSMAFLGLTGAWDVARRRWHERRAETEGHPACRACGYDLTGNVSGVCPECGTPTSLNGDRPAPRRAEDLRSTGGHESRAGKP